MQIIIFLSLVLIMFMVSYLLYSRGYKREAIELKNTTINFFIGYTLLILILITF